MLVSTVSLMDNPSGKVFPKEIRGVDTGYVDK
jgi:hypothetical protein